MSLTPRVQAARRHAADHPLVRATLKAEREIRTRYPWARDWPLAIQEQVALIGLTHGRVFADRLGYGLRSRLQLIDESQCGYPWGDGHQCTETPRHREDHRCACGQKVCRGTPKYVKRTGVNVA